MTRYARTLCSLHSAVLLWLAYCTVQSARNGAVWAVLLFVAASLVSVIAVIRETENGDEQRRAAVRAELAARPPDMTRAFRDGIALGWADLHAACCLRAWETHGTAHDTTLCAGKDTAA